MLLTELKGIGEKTERLFLKLKIYNVEDLLNFYPRTYEIFEQPISINDIDNKVLVSIDGTVMKKPISKIVKSLHIVSTVIKDKKDNLVKVTWFNMPYIKNTINYGERYIFRGRVIKQTGLYELEQPIIYTLSKYDNLLNKMQPIYALTKGLTNNAIIKAMKQAIEFIKIDDDYLSDKYRDRYSLCDRVYAYKNIHFPNDEDSLISARKRLVFDEFFKFIYNMRKLKENEVFVKNTHVVNNNQYSDNVLNNLPYELTNAQKKVLAEIRDDMKSERVMQRLIQGDVGSGKTIIAFLAMFDLASENMQSVLMAPTEVLATQHFENLSKMIYDYKLPFKVVLLTGSNKQAERRIIYGDIESGSADFVIGTQAVFQDKVIFKNLGLVITDEQHRFGVMQRAAVKNKGDSPHVIVMSATPIPRTLAIILYGDLDISVINELPAKRLPIKNCVVTKDYRPKAYNFIEKEINKGRQAYVICPMVEENDTLEAENVIDYAKKLKQVLGNSIKIEYLHGKMKPDIKNEIMKRFSNNEIQVLVSTTVIEVGINVPNATVMMVENAERFGLASLHQLRGRVGRGEYQSYCIFVSATTKKEKLERLEILNKSNDGFFIASSDLKMRGPGDFFGIRQSGEMQFTLADIYTDSEIMKDASQAVDEFIANNNELVDKRLNNDIVIY